MLCQVRITKVGGAVGGVEELFVAKIFLKFPPGRLDIREDVSVRDHHTAGSAVRA